jgi:hypothetical protein
MTEETIGPLAAKHVYMDINDAWADAKQPLLTTDPPSLRGLAREHGWEATRR